MKSIFYFILLFFISITNCKENEIKKKPVSIIDEKVIEANKILSVKFNSSLILKWDVNKSNFVLDSSYNSIKKQKKNLSELIENISNNENLNISICSKKGNLKKGDIAFLYLKSIGKIELFKCLHLQFDLYNQNCLYPDELLDYVEKNRIKVKQQVKTCLKEL